MWKQRLQQLGQRRNNNKRSNNRDRDLPRPRANTVLPDDSPQLEYKPPDISAPAPEPVSAPDLRRRMTAEDPSSIPPTKASLKTWWNHFVFAQRARKEAEEKKGQNVVFGKPLKESLKYASVQISTANANGELYVWGYIPVVVAKCGLYLKEAATEIEGTFRVNGSNKRMRELQAAFETPPRYGKNMDWKKEQYTTHDVASVFRRFLTQMPEPVIPHDMYFSFREALAKKNSNQDETITTYKRLIRSLPRANQYLLLYVLDLLSVFARKSDKNLMTAKNLAVIFRPALLSHPSHELSPQEHQLSQDVLEFLIAHQDWFMLDIPPPPTAASVNSKSGAPALGGMNEQVDIIPSSDDEQPGGWKLVDKASTGSRRIARRRTTTERSGDSGGRKPNEGGDLSPVLESPPSRTGSVSGGTVTRRRTLPSKTRSPENAGTVSDDGQGNKLLKRQKRASAQPKQTTPSSSQS
ncbi:Rho GTPase activation protein [Cristinia sonorae]|uniref:Rho GTPase activation protein n=1 Tax=Cristinia sonorae TaxID=1940300 RepID=A0A8K0UP47_9AGAR|nr:Rho GTPase activation protein [Cristinia sonorae]